MTASLSTVDTIARTLRGVTNVENWYEAAMGGGGVTVTFDNGYAVSVVRHMGSYGNKHGEGLFEAALMGRDGLPLVDGTVDTWHDVRGWLDLEAVLAIFAEVRAL